MKSGIVLVVSASLSNDDLCSSPFNLHPEEFFLASYDSLCFLGFSRFCLVILHEPDPDICTKLSLGIRDSRLLEGMWNLVALSNSPVRIISSPKNRPLKSLLDLGVEPFSPSEVRDFLSSLSSPKNSASFNPKKQPLLTADDIREMHKMGKLRLEPGALLTEWAKEVAVTLGISLPEKQANFVLAFLSTPTRASLIDLSEKIHSWSRANPKLLFVVPSPQIPLFRELFPSISSRLVAPAFHWAESGAFTGEVSLGMIQDAGCFGAIMPHSKPFFTKEQILQIAEKAEKIGLYIFVPNFLEHVPEYDIMTRRIGAFSSIIKLIDLRNSSAFSVGDREAVFVSIDDVEKGRVSGWLNDD